MRRLPIVFFLVGASALTFSCGSSYHLRKAQRHIAIAKELGANVTQDTIFSQQFFEVESVKFDTVVISKPQDTVYLTTERLKVKIVRLPGDSIWVAAKCDSVVVTRDVPVYIETKIESGYQLRHLIGGGALLLMAGIVLGFILKRR